MEEDEYERGFDSFVAEAVNVASSDTFQQAMGFHFAEVIAELGEGVGGGWQAECSKDSLMDVGGTPSVELCTAVQQYLHQPDHAGVVDLNAGDFGLADGDRILWFRA